MTWTDEITDCYATPTPAQALCRWAVAGGRPVEQGEGAVARVCKACQAPLAANNHSGVCTMCQRAGGRCATCGKSISLQSTYCARCGALAAAAKRRAARATPGASAPPVLPPLPAPAPPPLPPIARVAADPCPVGPSHLLLPYSGVVDGFTAYCTLCAPHARPDAHKHESDLLPRRPKPRERGERVA